MIIKKENGNLVTIKQTLVQKKQITFCPIKPLVTAKNNQPLVTKKKTKKIKQNLLSQKKYTCDVI